MAQPFIYDGSGADAPVMTPLRAGKLSLLYGDGMIRNVRWGDVPILHSVYAAVRDRNWGTVPGVLTLREQQIDAASFRLVFEMRHQRDEIDFSWIGTITGSADGMLTFDFDGVANSTFDRNRIGFCILHPMDVAGAPCVIKYVDGRLAESEFPRTIAAHQPFFDIRAITHIAAPGVRATVLMDGDTFEMEDQRNWIDASFKTYCTPLSLPFPVTVEAGTRVRQTIIVGVSVESNLTPKRLPSEAVEEKQAIRITLMDNASPLPAIGLAMASHGEPLTEHQVNMLRQLNLSHLRAEVRLYEGDASGQFERGVNESRLLDVPLELAIFVDDGADQHLASLAEWIDLHQPTIRHLAIFTKPGKQTEKTHAQLARKHLGRFGFPIGGGTDAYFTEFNRLGTPTQDIDFVTYSINPQVHAFDNASLVETLAAHAPTVETAWSRIEMQPIHVSPVTFKIRWNPNATAPDSETPPGVLPRRVDPRQSSLFGAGWTLGSIKYLAEHFVSAVTYYETTGWLGVMATEAGSSLPDQFHDTPGGVYPMWHVFKRIGAFKGGNILATQSSDPLKVEVLGLWQDADAPCVILANLTADVQQVEMPYPADHISVYTLDETTFSATGEKTVDFIHSSGSLPENDKALFRISLRPYGLAFLNVTW